MRDYKPVFGPLTGMDSFELSARGSFEAGNGVLMSPSRAFKACPDPDTVPCESCGQPVFLLSVRGPDVPQVKHWMEPAVLVGPATLEMHQHTPERCRAGREDDRG